MAKVLIIDDDAGIREMLEDTLKLAKHEVDTAVDGRKAKELYDKNDYQVIITDIIMPGQDGFEVTLELRNRGMIDRVIAISGGGRTSSGTYAHYGTLASLYVVYPVSWAATFLVQVLLLRIYQRKPPYCIPKGAC